MTTDLIIHSLKNRSLMLPLKNPIRTASGAVTHAPLILIDLEMTSGIVGHSYLFTYTPNALKAVNELLNSLSAVVAGMACTPQEIFKTLDARFRLLGNTGLVTIALAGIDMAAWDCLAKSAKRPLVELLGGTNKPVPCYFSQGMDGLARSEELAYECLERGFGAMKIKVGYDTLDEDIAVVRAVQKVLGNRARLAVDYNQSLSYTDALRRCNFLDTLDLLWIEEPILQDDFEGHSRLATEIKTPIMLGENWFGTQEMAKALKTNACDLVMPDLMKIGGVTGWLRAATLAHAARLPMSSHLFPEITAHLMSVTPTTYLLEILELAEPVLKTPLKIIKGMAYPNTDPGNGIEWNETAIKQLLD
jgi:mandelate racemase